MFEEESTSKRRAYVNYLVETNEKDNNNKSDMNACRCQGACNYTPSNLSILYHHK